MRTLIPLIAAALLIGCRGQYERQSSYTVLSVRAVDLRIPQTELARAVEGTAKTRGAYNDYFNEAVEQALMKVPGGNVLVNVVVMENTKRNTLMVRGDVWGTGSATPAAPVIQSAGMAFAVGDAVAWKHKDRLTTGTIVGLRPTGAIVEYDRTDAKGTATKELREVPIDQLTKVQR